MASLGKRLCFYTACELIEAYKGLTISPVDVVKDVIKRIQEVNDRVCAYCFVEDEKLLLKQAQESEQRYKEGKNLPLDGIPISIKDLLLTKGWKTRFGSKAYVQINQKDGDVGDDDYDAPSVQRVREAGAIMIGKVTTPEFGWEGITSSPLTGITRNPLDPKYTAGGSSGGSSAAVALGMAPLSLGSDAGGSVRIPSGFCNTSTIKATFAKVAHAPPSAFGTLSNVGPMAVTIEDVALLLDVIGKPDLRDPYSVSPHLQESGNSSPAIFSSNLKKGVKGMKIAVSLDLGGYVPYVHPQIKQSITECAKVFEQLGAEVVYDDPPLKQFDIYKAFKVLWSVGAAHLCYQKIPQNYINLLDNGLKNVAEKGKQYSGVDVMASEHIRTTMCQAMSQFHQKYDLLITPTLPIPPFNASQEVPKDEHFSKDKVAGCESPFFEESDRERWWTWTPFSYPFNLTRQPAASVPCGFLNDPLLDTEQYMNPFPVGLHIIGPLHSEVKILQAAYAFQSATNYLEPIFKLQSI